MRNIAAWYRNNTEQDLHKDLQRAVSSAEHTVGGALPSLKDYYTRHCKNKAKRIIKDHNHPDNGLLSLLQLWRWYRIHQAITQRLRKSFYPQATRIQMRSLRETATLTHFFLHLTIQKIFFFLLWWYAVPHNQRVEMLRYQLFMLRYKNIRVNGSAVESTYSDQPLIWIIKLGTDSFLIKFYLNIWFQVIK